MYLVGVYTKVAYSSLVLIRMIRHMKRYGHADKDADNGDELSTDFDFGTMLSIKLL
jgi:hypothetical protein